ncbi:hypothetical protein M407DRAFT_102654 [Tulasnella calospora MUT 4182]|uniref:Uncharacterized protein n=1 Tax=Tulasnella calospora MUT 4182 TaxID=1051891 RepID=A0A0C3QFY3_9AGAM|nr:hypothetical protein M407DRAFT_102654 [Tulasnella calospora MUT 4182]
MAPRLYSLPLLLPAFHPLPNFCCVFADGVIHTDEITSWPFRHLHFSRQVQRSQTRQRSYHDCGKGLRML